MEDIKDTKEQKQEPEVKEPDTKEDKIIEPEVKEPEKKEAKIETEKANSIELEKATKTIEDLTNQLNTATEQIVELDAVKKDLADAREEIEKANKTVKDYEDMLNKMIEEKMKGIPEEFSELVPSNMTIIQQLEWLAKAEAKNLFKKDKGTPNVEIGKPMGASVDTKVDTKNMSNSSILSMAYNVLKK